MVFLAARKTTPGRATQFGILLVPRPRPRYESAMHHGEICGRHFATGHPLRVRWRDGVITEASHTPGDSEYGPTVERALGYVIANAKPSGLLNMSDPQRDMYNHGLSTFVLGQAYGMTSDRKVGAALDKALRVIVQTQGPVGSWAYQAQAADGDLSLCVMQAKALRSATDSGFEIPRKTIEKAMRRVRSMYLPGHGVVNQG